MIRINIFFIVFLTFVSYRAYSIEIVLDGDWFSINDQVDLVSAKMLVQRSNGLTMASPYRQMLAKGDGWVKVFHQYEGHSAEFLTLSHSCFDIAVTYKTGSNLLVLKLFKIQQNTDIDELFGEIKLVSNLGKITIDDNLITLSNQLVLNSKRVQKVTTYELTHAESSDMCVIKKQR